MAFEGLSSKLQEFTKKLRGKTRITESDLKEMLREVKLALLDADVNYKIVKEFTASIQEKALGQDVLKSLTPGQQVVKIVKDELVELLGGTEANINFSSNPPTIIMLVGLQGSGKTTTAGKLANLLRKQGKKPLLVACDVYRPAAIKQLQVVGAQLNIPVFANENSKDVVHIAKQAMSVAYSKLNDVVILDTAGRLQIDEELMNELKNVKASVHPHEILLVVDSMTGQEAVNVATGFNDALGIDGVILTKLDGDTRGGAGLSVKKVTGKPIKFVGMGEKLSELEVFHPDRMASRILGMGDVLSIIEKAEESFDQEEAEKLTKQLAKKEQKLEKANAQTKELDNTSQDINKILGSLKPTLINKNNMIISSEDVQKIKNYTKDVKDITKTVRSVNDLNIAIKDFEHSTFETIREVSSLKYEIELKEISSLKRELSTKDKIISKLQTEKEKIKTELQKFKGFWHSIMSHFHKRICYDKDNNYKIVSDDLYKNGIFDDNDNEIANNIYRKVTIPNENKNRKRNNDIRF